MSGDGLKGDCDTIPLGDATHLPLINEHPPTGANHRKYWIKYKKTINSFPYCENHLILQLVRGGR